MNASRSTPLRQKLFHGIHQHMLSLVVFDPAKDCYGKFVVGQSKPMPQFRTIQTGYLGDTRIQQLAPRTRHR